MTEMKKTRILRKKRTTRKTKLRCNIDYVTDFVATGKVWEVRREVIIATMMTPSLR